MFTDLGNTINGISGNCFFISIIIFLTQKKEILIQELEEITKDFKEYPYIFNLGHGITPDARVDNVELVVDYIKGLKF